MKYVFFEMKSYPYGVGFRMPEGVVYQLTNNAVHDYFRVVAEAPVSQVGRKLYVDPLRRTQFFDKGGDCFFESEVIQNMGADIGRNIPDADDSLIHRLFQILLDFLIDLCRIFHFKTRYEHFYYTQQRPQSVMQFFGKTLSFLLLCFYDCG